MTNDVIALPADDELDKIFDGLGLRLKDEDMISVWPVEGLVHPGITCILGQPERGKTTLLMSLTQALLRSDERWLGGEIAFPRNRRIVYFAEDASSATRVKQAFAGTNVEGRLVVLTLGRWETSGRLRDAVAKVGAVLVIVDSVYSAVGDVNEQARADAFLGVIHAARVPTVVVHHEGKDNGRTPAGVQMFRAAYRHTLRVCRCTPADGGEMLLDLDVWGNDVPGHRSLSVRLNRNSLECEALAPAENGGQAKRRRRQTVAERAEHYGAKAWEAGLAIDVDHNQCATVLLGGPRGREDPDLATEFGVKHLALGNAVRDHREDFKRGYQAAQSSA